MEKILINNFENYVKNLKILDENIFNLSEQMNFLRMGIISKRESAPDMKAEDVREELIKIQELNYEVTLKYQEGINMANIIVELFTIIKASDTEYSLGDDQEFVDSLVKGNRRLFVISEKDRSVGVADIAAFNEQLNIIRTDASDPEKLERMLNSPSFMKNKK
jgi:hypothetical protein